MKHVALPIGVFTILAFALSWSINHFLPELIVSGLNVKEILTGFGPAVSGLICYWLFGTPNTYKLSLTGSRPALSVGIVALSLSLPLLFLAKPDPILWAGFVLTQFVYTLGEELGWRHYLQNAVAPLNGWQQAGVIGLCWFLWHYAILDDPTTMLTGQSAPAFIGIPLMVGLLSLLSKLLGDIVSRTQAVFLPVSLHYIGKVGNSYMLLAVFGIVMATHIYFQKIARTNRPKSAKSHA
ncbi:CPBP family intramembrane metalloprotease [Rudanella paleaurantiibacter]|uniref:CPBP family intramembrane metalloprotease n=1 Tax=Rudanella paleaurantiibacter TaxID=2614655 RepID=A0A7J5TTZ5_9BACT|nr:CPBP family glutamic-type intramembrane protease [Rudanella paleaurantiibacter]KAB7727365.1 CPBP family intramembrane metalloprotease [Rudanella paleaurantiibacter]